MGTVWRNRTRALAATVAALTLTMAAATSPQAPAADGAVLSLAGPWRLSEGVIATADALASGPTVALPGSLTESGFGDDITMDTPWIGQVVDQSFFSDDRYAPYREPGNVKVPFWLTPLKHFVGARWFSREITIPDQWDGKGVVLFLERCKWETEVWLNGRRVGMRNSLVAPHVYDLGPLPPGRHVLSIQVDNTMKINVGQNAHSVSDHTQTSWLGIIGRMELQAVDPVRIADVQLYPDIVEKSVRARVRLVGADGGDLPEGFRGRLTLRARPADGAEGDAAEPVTQEVASGDVELVYAMGEGARLWDEFSPSLYTMTVTVEGPGGAADTFETDFGLRTFTVRGTRFYLNDRPIFLRGTLECAIFPLTGYPPMDREGWLRILRVCRAHGLNHLRFHSWCPPRAAFEAADRMGFIFQVEGPAWATIGDGQAIDPFIYDEGDRILKEYGNHPSFCMLAYGNEPGGQNQRRWLGDLVNSWKEKDDRRLYTSAAGWPQIPENQFHVPPEPRAHAWGSGLSSRLNARPPETRSDYRDYVARWDVPVVSHEIGQWCVFPDFNEIEKYTGVTRALNFEVFRDFLDANHMLDQAQDFLMASGKLQTLCYKEDIESALRTPGFGGFQLLDLHDFPGQGTALVGVLDPFWDSKPYVTPDEYRRFAGETVPLARMDKRVWTSDETFEADIEMFHFGPAPIENPWLVWRIRAGDLVVAEMTRERSSAIPLGQGIPMGSVSFALSNFDQATALNLEVALEGTPFANDWDFWVYPAQVETAAPDAVLVVRDLDERALEALADGGRVLLVPGAGRVRGDEYGKVPPAFSTIFWNTAWTSRQPPHTMGILCDPDHPMFAHFPTEYHTNWQWWDVIHQSQFMILQDFPAPFRPTVQIIDTWFDSRKLGLVFEAQVGGGRLLVCGADLMTDLDTRPAARQLRHSILAYMAGEDFDPQDVVDVETVQGLFQPPSPMQQAGARVHRVNSFAAGYGGEMAIDGDPSTIWHTAWGDDAPDFPHEIVIAFDEPPLARGLRYLPRQDMRNGWFTEYAVYVSDDPDAWGEPVSAGALATDGHAKEILFDEPVRGRYLRFVPKKSHDGQVFAAVAELEILAVE